MKKKDNKVSFGDFDDCVVCRAEKMAEERGHPLTESELMEAFEKAREQGAVVGGPMFDDDSKAAQQDEKV